MRSIHLTVRGNVKRLYAECRVCGSFVWIERLTEVYGKVYTVRVVLQYASFISQQKKCEEKKKKQIYRDFFLSFFFFSSVCSHSERQ